MRLFYDYYDHVSINKIEFNIWMRFFKKSQALEIITNRSEQEDINWFLILWFKINGLFLILLLWILKKLCKFLQRLLKFYSRVYYKS